MSTASVHGRASWWALAIAIAIVILATTSVPASAQCTNPTSYGAATIDPAGARGTISTCSFAGEYSTINGAVSGQSLRFTTSIGTDYITIRSGTPNGPVRAFGQTPLVLANIYTGTLYAHWSANASCATQSTCRVTTVQLWPQCTFASSFGAATIDRSGALVTISTCSFGGEYSTINGAVNGQTLRFLSSVATDYITIHSGAPDGPVIAAGPTPLVFANTYTGTLYPHWAANSTCGTASACRTTSVQCTTCVFRNGFE